MNAPLRPDATPRLEDFPYRLSDNVRFADLDPNQHVNNAVYATYFETGRVTLMKDRSYGLMPDGVTWIMVRLDMHFRAELRWPGTIEMGLGVVKFGRTSVTFDQVVFSEGKCVASAQSVSVLLDEATRKQLERGRMVTELMKQPQYQPLQVWEMALTLFAVNNGYFDDIDVKKALAAEKSMRDYTKTKYASLVQRMEEKKDLSAEDEKALHEAIKDWKKSGSF